MSALPAQTAKCSGAKPWHAVTFDVDSHICVTLRRWTVHQAILTTDDMHIFLLHRSSGKLTCVARQAQLLQLLGGCAAGPHKVPWPHGRD